MQLSEHETTVSETVRKLRILTAAILCTLPVIAVIGFRLPRLSLPFATPVVVTVVAAALGLVLSLGVERVAQRLLRRIKRTYAEHGSRKLLIVDYVRAYVTVMAVIELVAICGLVVAAAGTGPRTSLWFVGIAAVLAVLAWPTSSKVHALLRRADDLARLKDEQTP